MPIPIGPLGSVRNSENDALFSKMGEGMQSCIEKIGKHVFKG